MCVKLCVVKLYSINGNPLTLRCRYGDDNELNLLFLLKLVKRRTRDEIVKFTTLAIYVHLISKAISVRHFTMLTATGQNKNDANIKQGDVNVDILLDGSWTLFIGINLIL